MQPADYQRFKAVMTGMGKLYERELDKPLLDAYWLALTTWSLTDFEAGAGQLMRTSEFLPRPAAFEALRQAGRPTAAEAWERARRASGSAIQCGHVTHNGTCGDELIDRAVRGIGGYGVIAMCETDKLPFLERRFAEHYSQLQDAEEVRQAVPQIAGPSTLRISGPRRASDFLPKRPPSEAA